MTLRSLDPPDVTSFPINRKIWLRTDKRNVLAEGHQADLLILQYMNDYAKATIAFKDKDGNDVGWLQAHNYLDEALTNQHKHMSLETSDSGGQLQTRLDIPYGSDIIDMKVTSANFIVSDGYFEARSNARVRPLSGNAIFKVQRRAADTSQAGFILSNYISSTETDYWAMRMSDSGNNMFIRNVNNGINVIKAMMGSGNACRIFLRATATASTDGDLENSSINLWLDQSTNKLMVRAKYSDGTLKSGEIALV